MSNFSQAGLGQGQSPACPSPERLAEIADNLTVVRGRIETATVRAGREPGSVSLLVVTKMWPATDVMCLAQLGVRAVGENRVKELAQKRRVVESAGVGMGWHLVGALQTNKAAAAASSADLIESVDRPRLVAALERAAVHAGLTISCLVQVSLDPEPRLGRSGVLPTRVRALADSVVEAEGLHLEGVMGVAPQGLDPRPAFDELARAADAVMSDHPGARMISAGMSSDFTEAIAAGATQVRIGTSVLGDRANLR